MIKVVELFCSPEQALVCAFYFGIALKFSERDGSCLENLLTGSLLYGPLCAAATLVAIDQLHLVPALFSVYFCIAGSIISFSDKEAEKEETEEEDAEEEEEEKEEDVEEEEEESEEEEQ